MSDGVDNFDGRGRIGVQKRMAKRTAVRCGNISVLNIKLILRSQARKDLTIFF
jgi:hypothetical protein